MSKVRSVTKNPFITLERIWAEHGVVKMQDKKGKVVSLSVRDAAMRAQAINNMVVPDWHKQAKNTLVTKIVEVVREAKSQQETPVNAQEAEIMNILNNKTPKGVPIEAATRTFSQELSRYMYMYPGLTERDILPILENDSIPFMKKEEILREINRQNTTMEVTPTAINEKSEDKAPEIILTDFQKK